MVHSGLFRFSSFRPCVPTLSFVSSPEDEPEDDGDAAEGAGGEAGGEGDGGGGAMKESMKPCQFCRRPFRKERIAKHEDACKKMAKAIGKCDFRRGIYENS